MSRVVIVDWLGRGGIAQVSAAWAIELRSSGHEVTVVSRGSRELAADLDGVVTARASQNPVLAHRAVAALAERTITGARPDVVVFQNYIIPVLERAAHAAAWATRSRVLVAIHDHRLHSPLAGTHVGLAGLLRRADRVVAHTEFVASAVRRLRSVPPVEVVPHPLPLSVLAHAGDRPAADGGGEPMVAIHLGVLKRRYKGTATVLRLARQGVAGWRFVVVGTGAPRDRSVETISGYVPAAELCRLIAGARACLLPYERASQSGAVVLCQALGCVPVATAVGGIPEQVSDGRTGYLVAPGAPLRVWEDVLTRLSDDTTLRRIQTAAAAAVETNHRVFVQRIVALVGGGWTGGGTVTPPDGRRDGSGGGPV